MRLVNDEAVESQPSFFKKITYTDGIYPLIRAEIIQNPSRLFAFPLLGILIKIIICLPIVFEIVLVNIWWFIVVLLINPFIVLLTGKYWQHAYQLTLGLLRLSTKLQFYLFGLTDKYPGFKFTINDKFSLEFTMPENPSRLFAIPLFGGLVRIIFLIPYSIFSNIISSAAMIGVFSLAWAVVLFKGRYPEGIFELARDSIRVELSLAAYLAGISDRYPSFYISMAHDKIKIILIAIVVILNVGSFFTGR